MEEALYASIIECAKVPACQEDILRNCQLAREYENFMDLTPAQFSSSPDLTPSQPTEILVISPPGSSGSVNQHLMEEDPVFLTPPEHHSHSHLSSSEDQNPIENCAQGFTIVEASDGSHRATEAERVTVVPEEEFEGETVPLGETQVIEIERDEGVQDTNVVSDYADSGGEEKAASCLAEGSLEVAGDASTVGVAQFDALNVEEIRATEGKNSNGNNNSSVSLGIDQIGEEIVVLEHNVGEKCSEVQLKNGSSGSEKVDEILKDAETPKDIHIDVGRAAGGAGRKRELPPSLKSKEEVVGNTKKKSGLLDLLNDLKAILGDTEDESEEEDIMEIAKKCGWSFPRPRWWPAEGEDWSQ